MKKLPFIHLFVILSLLLSGSCVKRDIKDKNRDIITPDQFKGSDIQRIRSAVNAANRRLA